MVHAKNIRRMKRTIMTLLSVTASLALMAQKPCKIEGKVADDLKSNKIYIYVSNEKLEITEEDKDSVPVKKGKFSFEAPANGFRRIVIVPSVDNGKGVSMNQIRLLSVPGEKAVLDITREGATIGGTKFYQEWGAADKSKAEVYAKLKALQDNFAKEVEGKSDEEVKVLREKVMPQYKELVEAYRKCPDMKGNELGALMFWGILMGEPVEAYDKMDASLRDTEAGKLLKERADKQRANEEARAKEEAEAKKAEEASGEGKMFTDFECEYNGKVQKLSDYVGKGKYVLVDFWASWCGPCKAEIPNLIKVYEKYKGDKFEVLGVATWDKPKDTEKAIQQMNIPYPQIINAQKAGSDAYGIMGIPQIILFAPDGKILKRDLRGAAIEEELQKIFN